VFLSLTTTHRPATDLGFLLHKHPDKIQRFAQSYGDAWVFYPEASEERCTAALVLETDSTRLARTLGRNTPDFSLAQYVNDRPYAASSLLAGALADVFRTARRGTCTSRPELAASPIPLEVEIPALPCRGGRAMAERFFAPLGWEVEAVPVPLDEEYPSWGNSRYLRLRLTGMLRLADALSQLYVLLPALDEAKHYWQGPDEVDKLLGSGQGWLAGHPERELITRRYLGRGAGMVRLALARLAELDDKVDDPEEEVAEPAAPPPLNRQRHAAVLDELRALGASSVIDLGCGPGAFLAELGKERSFTRIAGTDASVVALRRAAQRLHLDRLGEREAARWELFHGALTYTDPRLAGFDAAVLMEVIEHIDLPRLEALERVVFGAAHPGAVVVTTPNAEYNVNYEGLSGMRHCDHRFEWTRAEFTDWAERVGSRYGYSVEVRGIGEPDPVHGTPTQLGVFRGE